jgi:hypothetical protein
VTSFDYAKHVSSKTIMICNVSNNLATQLTLALLALPYRTREGDRFPKHRALTPTASVSAVVVEVARRWRNSPNINRL